MTINDPVITAQTPATDFTIEQCWDVYTPDEHAIWNALYDNQIRILADRAVPEFYEGITKLNLNKGGVPNLKTLNEELQKLTNWTVVTVPHLVPDDVFFNHLANRRFPAGRFIRGRDQMDYIQEPDIFHDVFGHVPMLTQPVFANYMQAYGKGGLRALETDHLKNLTRLYWYTVEYGLMRTDQGFKIYGAGMSSSRTESIFSTDSDSPNRIHFDLERIMRTNYRIDDFQQVYFVIDDFAELFDATQQDFGPIYDRLSDSDKIYDLTEVLPTDVVHTKGTQAYAKAGGRLAKAS